MNDEEMVASRATALMETAIAGDMVALDVERGACFGFNSTATRIWALLEAPTPVAALIDRLVHEFAVDRARCRDDVVTLLRRLEDQGLVRLTPAG